MRVHRSALERLLFADVFRCRDCGRRNRRLHARTAVRLRYLFSLHTHCPRCGTADVIRRKRRDKVETMSAGLLSRLARLTGAPVRFCGACRLQYYDWRPSQEG
jgi:hypothetical protein